MYKNFKLLIILFLICLTIIAFLLDDKQIIFTTAIGTALGGAISILVTLGANDFTINQKLVLARKEEIYVPIYNELKDALVNNKVNSRRRKLSRNFTIPILQKTVGNKSIYINNNLYQKLEYLQTLLSNYSFINHESIAKALLKDGFNELLKNEFNIDGILEYEDENGIPHVAYNDSYEYFKSS